jgi:hypothetical protein
LRTTGYFQLLSDILILAREATSAEELPGSRRLTVDAWMWFVGISGFSKETLI